MENAKPPRSLASLSRATDTLSTLLAQQVRELNLQQRAARREGGADPEGIERGYGGAQRPGSGGQDAE